VTLWWNVAVWRCIVTPYLDVTVWRRWLRSLVLYTRTSCTWVSSTQIFRLVRSIKKSYFSHLHSWEFIVQFYLLWQLRFEVLKTTSQECLLLPMSTISKRCSKHLHLDENFARGVINYLRSKAALRQSFLACVYCMQLRFQSNYLGFSQSR